MKYPLKEARIRAKRTLVQVAAEAHAAVGTVQRFEVAPESVREDVRERLAVVYAAFDVQRAA